MIPKCSNFVQGITLGYPIEVTWFGVERSKVKVRIRVKVKVS